LVYPKFFVSLGYRKRKKDMKNIIKTFKSLPLREKLELAGNFLVLVSLFALLYVGLWLIYIIGD